MNFLSNIDLLTVGIAIAANLLIGLAVFLSSRKSATHILFFIQTIVLSTWSLANYISYQPHNAQIAIFLVRLVLFFAVPNSIVFLVLMHTFPSDVLKISKKTLFLLSIICVIVMIITLSPLLFKDVKINSIGAPTPVPGIGIIPFIATAILSLPLGIYYLIRNYFYAAKEQKKQFFPLLVGVSLMFTAIVLLNFILPTAFGNSRFIPLSALFTLPFVIATAYSIYRHKLFNIKDIVTLFIALALTIVTFIEIVFADTAALVIFRVSIFILVLIFSIQLIRNMFNLEFANDRLKELDQLKSEFVSLATHQIRAPLTAIKGYVSLIQEGDYGQVNPEVQKALGVVMDSTNNLVTIVGDFLDVSRIEQGRMKYDISDFDLQELAAEVANEYKPNIEKKGLEFNYSFFKGKNYIVHADRGKIKQVIGNVLDNSIKYTPKGKIEMSVAVVADKARVRIADTGVGIKPETMPKLFQKFSRAEDANRTNILGTGLGLYVAHNMMEAMSGRIWAESAGEGKGSQFYVELAVKAQ